MAATTLSADPAIRALQDRIDITDVLYRYASTIDRFDLAGLRSVLADDLWAQYGNADPVVGGDAVAAWIGEAIANVVWQHHLLSVYHVEVDGDRASALVYHTSHQVFEDDPDTAKLLVGRYHNELRRERDGWKISRLVLEILWGEEKTDAAGYLALIGGRGPRGCPARPSRSPRAPPLRNRLVGTAHGAGSSGRAAAARGRRVLAAAGGGRCGDADRRRHACRARVDGPRRAQHRRVASGGPGRHRGASRGDPLRRRRRGLPARAPRARDDRRRHWFHPVGPPPFDRRASRRGRDR